MIYEFRTYTLKVGSQPEVIKRFGERYETRKKHSEMAAFWYTDIGPLNQIIHVWPYEDMNQRSEIRAACVEAGDWPPAIGEFVTHQTSEIFHAMPFVPALQPGSHGPVYEMRYYEVQAGTIPAMTETWKEALPARLELSPIVAAMTSDTGMLNKFIHIWPYKSLEERSEVRAKAAAAKIWPPRGGGGAPLDQKNLIMYPAPFSPMQ